MLLTLGTTCERLLQLIFQVINHFVYRFNLFLEGLDLSQQPLDLVVALEDRLGCRIKLASPLRELTLELIDLCLQLGFHGLCSSLEVCPLLSELFDQVIDLGLHLCAHALELLAHFCLHFAQFRLIVRDQTTLLLFKQRRHFAAFGFVLLLHFCLHSLMRRHKLLDLGLQLVDQVATLILEHIDLFL